MGFLYLSTLRTIASMPPPVELILPVPGIRHAVHQLSDPAEFAIAVSGGHLIADFFAKQECPTRIEQFQTPLWALDFQQANVKAHIHCPLPGDWASVGLMRSPVESSWYGRQAVAGVLMCNPPGQAIDGCIVPGFQCLTMSVPATVWERCGALAGRMDDGFENVSAICLPPETYARIERELTSILPLLRNAAKIPGYIPEATEWVDGLVIDVLTMAWELSSGVEIGMGSSRNRTRLAHRAEEWMRAHLGDAIQVPDVCLALGVSRRELEYAFRLTFDESPRDFLQAMRLNAVRRALKHSSSHRSLIDIAFDHGITHLGRFAKNYRTLFGENPSFSRLQNCPRRG